ncbi:MAG: cell division topological specificity factor MinE [Geminicoccaceae bacterium]
MNILHRAFGARGAERLLGLFRSPSAAAVDSAKTAKERLQVVLALERNAGSGPSFLPQLQEELLQVIKKYVDIDNENVSIELERGPEASMLDINIELPTKPRPSRRLPVLQSAT